MWQVACLVAAPPDSATVQADIRSQEHAVAEIRFPPSSRDKHSIATNHVLDWPARSCQDDTENWDDIEVGPAVGVDVQRCLLHLFPFFRGLLVCSAICFHFFRAVHKVLPVHSSFSVFGHDVTIAY